MSTFSIGLDSLTSMKNSESKKFSHKCRICRAPAEHTHFGVISCNSCKMFFRRNDNTEQRKFRCYFDGQCKIHINTRPLCTACRLAKCFKCGMSTDLFRATRKNKPNRKALVKVQAQYQPKRLPTLNLLQFDKSLLNTNQWTLLTNLYNAYNESELLSIGQQIQSKYAEITWKYLLYRYGHYEAVKGFLNLISWFGAITISMFHAQTLALHVNDVNSLVEQTELSLILDDVDEILETNKTSV